MNLKKNHYAWFICIISFVSVCVFFHIEIASSGEYSNALNLISKGQYTQAIKILEPLVQSNPSAANYRALAQAYEGAERFEAAAQAYFKEAEIYRKLGDVNAARVEYLKGSALASRLNVFMQKPDAKIPAGFFTGAKFEPIYGCYIGAFVDKDDQIQTGLKLDWRDAGDKDKFAELTGKAHASYFNYFRYGTPFPTKWVEHLREAGAVPQIAWEVGRNGLQQVNDDDYLQEFARDAKDTDVPIFLRFAGEMNGDWTGYGTPKEYIGKFRLVHDVMERLAPNVAMVWSPNCIPEKNIAAYYPGDKYVDWVGLSMYTVHHHDNNLARPGEKEDPTDNLRYIYELYSKKKPIMISEHAVTHFCKAENAEVEDFAVDKIRYLYAALPRLFPRVKMISWYDNNNILHAQPGRQLNNYCLTDNESVLAAYHDSIAEPYYLTQVVLNKDSQLDIPPLIEEFKDGVVLKGTQNLSALAKTYVSRPDIVYLLDGKEMKRSKDAPYALNLDTTELKNGKHILKVNVYDDKNRLAISRQLSFVVKN